MYYANVNINLMVENVIQIQSQIMINADRSAEKHICEKDYIWNPATCSCKNGKYLASIIDNSVITCDEIIDTESKSNNKETKTVSTNFSTKFLDYTYLCINYHCIIDGCQYLLLSDKISSKKNIYYHLTS